MHLTEGGDDFDSKDLQTNWVRWSNQFAENLNNGARTITTWNLALNENGKPNIGLFHCAGMPDHQLALAGNPTQRNLLGAISLFSGVGAGVAHPQMRQFKRRAGHLRSRQSPRWHTGSRPYTQRQSRHRDDRHTDWHIEKKLSLPPNSAVTVLLS